jgi:hypothetical protein
VSDDGDVSEDALELFATEGRRSAEPSVVGAALDFEIGVAAVVSEHFELLTPFSLFVCTDLREKPFSTLLVVSPIGENIEVRG